MKIPLCRADAQAGVTAVFFLDKTVMKIVTLKRSMIRFQKKKDMRFEDSTTLRINFKLNHNICSSGYNHGVSLSKESQTLQKLWQDGMHFHRVTSLGPVPATKL